jgi:hypothetical protein
MRGATRTTTTKAAEVVATCQQFGIFLEKFIVTQLVKF